MQGPNFPSIATMGIFSEQSLTESQRAVLYCTWGYLWYAEKRRLKRIPHIPNIPNMPNLGRLIMGGPI